MEDGKNTYQERTESNLRQKQSEGGVECDENNRAGSQAKPGEEQVDCLQGKQLACKIFMQTGNWYLEWMMLLFPLHNHTSIYW